jgi:hypothetical protein
MRAKESSSRARRRAILLRWRRPVSPIHDTLAKSGHLDQQQEDPTAGSTVALQALIASNR